MTALAILIALGPLAGPPAALGGRAGPAGRHRPGGRGARWPLGCSLALLAMLDGGAAAARPGTASCTWTRSAGSSC